MIIKRSKRQKKLISVRSKFGRRETHELLIHKTNKNIYGYVNDLKTGNSVFSVSTLTLKKQNLDANGSAERHSFLIGKMIGDICKEKKIKPVINTAEYPFCGHVKELVEGFREIIES